MIPMPMRIGTKRRQHLYIEEWITAKQLTFEKVGARLDVDRTTVWRWAKEQHRLNPEKIKALADAMGIEPEQFWRLPDRPSVDAILKGESDATVQKAADMIRRMVS